MKRTAIALALLFTSISLEARTKEILSPIYLIDRIYRSMEGPYAQQDVTAGGSGEASLVWIRGMRVDVVAADGVTPLSNEFMCHVNLDVDAMSHASVFGADSSLNARVLTLTQGQMQAAYPETFAYPVASDEKLVLTTQVVNLRRPDIRLQARLRVTLDVADDPQRVLPLRPLLNTSVFASRPFEPKPGLALGERAVDAAHGATCQVPMPVRGVRAPNAMTTSDYTDSSGRRVTGHWIVPPGHQVTESDVTELMHLPFATTLHYAGVHVHPYCTSLELRDTTANATIFKALARSRNGGGLEHIDAYASADGTPLYPDHRYKLIAIYDNPTREDQDSMAAMFLGLFNPTFDRTRVALSVSSAIIRTTVGDLNIRFLPSVAPKTVAQFSRLARAGVYDGLPFVRLEKGFVAQTAVRPTPLAQRLPLETGAERHRAGVLSMAHPDGDPDGAETSFSVLLGDAPHLDGRYTVFARVEGSEATLAALEKAAEAAPAERPPIAITAIDINGASPASARTAAMNAMMKMELPQRSANAAK